MKLYPLYLKLKSRKCLVVGAGGVALRKVKTLLECGAEVTVISPQACKAIETLAGKNKISFIRSVYKKNFLKGMFLVIAATDNEKVNKEIAEAAGKMNILLNVVDVPALCSFYVPAVVRKKQLMISVSTQGDFPGLSAKIRRECESLMEKYSEALEVLARLRAAVKRHASGKKEKEKMIKVLLSDKVIAKIKRKQIRNFKDFLTYLD